MKCREFQSKVTDFVRAGGAEPSGELLRHAATCGQCSRRLRDERALNLALERVRDARAREETSPRIQESLLTEFRSARDHGCLVAGTVGERPWIGSGFRLRLAAAAVLLVSCGLVIWFAYSGPGGSAPIQRASGHPTSPPARPAQPTSQSESTVQAKGEGATRMLPAAEVTSPRAARRTVRAGRTGSKDRPARGAARDDRAPAAIETVETTPFMPTMLPLEMESDYGLQLVRMEVPRGTMVSFGLRVDRRKLDQPVKADLLIGPDGLTRAIRFVR